MQSVKENVLLVVLTVTRSTVEVKASSLVSFTADHCNKSSVRKKEMKEGRKSYSSVHSTTTNTSDLLCESAAVGSHDG